ncbi:hypothetical protein AAMO2058_001268100 [Amorphochlora amoebiformis]
MYALRRLLAPLSRFQGPRVSLAPRLFPCLACRFTTSTVSAGEASAFEGMASVLEDITHDIVPLRGRSTGDPEHRRLRQRLSVYDVVAGSTSVDYDGIARNIKETLPKETSASTRVLDFGCGGGRMGLAVKRAGLGGGGVVGLEFRKGIMEVLEAKGIYDTTVLAEVGRPLPLPSGSFDVIISAGTVLPKSTASQFYPLFNDFCRVGASGGLCVLTLRADVWDDLRSACRRAMGELEGEGKWEFVQEGEKVGFPDSVCTVTFRIW